MYPNKIILNFLIFILAISGLNGFLIEEGLLNINQSFLNLILDVALLIVFIFSIKNTKQFRQLFFVLLVFILLTVISFILNSDELNIIIYLNGLREFLPYFLFPIIYINLFQSSQRHFIIKKFNAFLYLFLFLQIPISFYQFSINGAGDMVGGTQGKGFSGNLTFIVFLSTFYLMTQGFDEKNIIRSFLKKSYLLIFWLPAFINETKISYILISLFVFLLVKLSISNIPKYIFIVILLFPALYIFNYVYQNTSNYFDSTEFLSSDFLEEYLTSDDEQYSDIPRFQKVAIFLTRFNKTEIILGKGIGQFKGGTTLALTPFASKYDWLLNGSVPMLFFLLVQVGIVGTSVFILYWILIITIKPRNQKISYSTNIITFCTVCFLIIQLYNESLRSLFFSGIMMYIICYAVYSLNSQIHNNTNFKS